MSHIINKKKAQADLRAQGTIEYLVIIGIVVVISLVVVSLIIGNADSAASASQNSSTIFSKISSGGISVTEAIGDYDGTGIINLSNYSGEARSLTKIITDEGENEYDDKLIGDDSIDISGLCNCEEGMKNKTCNFKFYFKETLEPINLQVTIKCEDDFEPKEPPTLPTDCFNPNKNPIPICSLTDLNQIRTNLSGNYILMKNIDATETSTWNSGLGWEPIGYCNSQFVCGLSGDVPFTGNFNGNNKIISNLIINRPTINGVGLFGHSTGNISNIGLDNVNISGSARTGGLIGWQSSGTILNSYTTGSVKHEIGNYGGVGGLIGWLSDGGIISKSYSTATVSCNKGQAGGLVGRQHSSVIINSYATGNISGSTYIGGLVGYMGESDFIGATITNSYSTGNVTGSINGVGGLVGYQRSYSENTLTISSSFSTGIVTCPGDGNGGLVGKQYNGGSISNSYFDKTGDKLDYMCGIGIEGSGCDNEKGIDTTLQPNYFYSSSNSPLSSWSSSDWILSGNDYPILQWQTE